MSDSDVVDRVVMLGDAQRPADHRPVGARVAERHLSNAAAAPRSPLGVLERVGLDAARDTPRSRSSHVE